MLLTRGYAQHVCELCGLQWTCSSSQVHWKTPIKFQHLEAERVCGLRSPPFHVHEVCQ